METVNLMGNADQKRPGMLYPVMLIAAIALIVFSVLGIATMMGWMPTAVSGAVSGSERAVKPAAMPGTGGSAKATATNRPRAVANAPVACHDCGVIESVRAVEVKGEGSGVGAIGGAVVGGILGNQVGRGSGRTAATVVGAGAGAYAGHEIEKNVKKSVSYQVRVRMNDGTYRTFYEPSQPALAVGQKVRVTEQGIIAAG